MENTAIDIDLFKQGHHPTFEKVYNKYKNQIFYFVWKIVGSQVEAEDIVSETFTKLFNLHLQFDTEPNIKAFLFITARNRSLNHLQYRERQSRLRKWLYYLNRDKYVTKADEKVVQTEAFNRMALAVETLPSKCREIFKLRVYDDLSIAEIAKQLNIEPHNVSSQLNKARNHLRQFL